MSTHSRNVALLNSLGPLLFPVYAAKRSFIRRYLSFHTRQISSFGGSGTTMLYRFLEKNAIGLPTITEGDWAPWKHMRSPPSNHAVQPTFRAVYVVSDPRDAVLSVFRRGYQHWHIQRTEGDVFSWNYSWTLEQFLASEHDHFRIREHFDNWTKADRSYAIMIIKYDALWENLPEVFRFVGARIDSLEEFPQKHERRFNWRNEKREIQDALNRLYGDLAEEIGVMREYRCIAAEEIGRSG